MAIVAGDRRAVVLQPEGAEGRAEAGRSGRFGDVIGARAVGQVGAGGGHGGGAGGEHVPESGEHGRVQHAQLRQARSGVRAAARGTVSSGAAEARGARVLLGGVLLEVRVGGGGNGGLVHGVEGRMLVLLRLVLMVVHVLREQMVLLLLLVLVLVVLVLLVVDMVRNFRHSSPNTHRARLYRVLAAENGVCRVLVGESDESEGPERPWDENVRDFAVLGEVLIKVFLRDVLRQTADENLAVVLGVILSLLLLQRRREA